VTISELCIRRPVFATVLSLLILLVGLIASQKLALREYPNVDQPVINVFTNYTGATSEVIESEITAPIEEAMSGLEGVDYISSTSRSGTSAVNITFQRDRDIEDAAAGVRDRLARVQYKLPETVLAPIIWKQEADSTPLMWLIVGSTRHEKAELTEIADDVIEDRLAVVEGVGEILIAGGRSRAMRIWVDRGLLAAYELSIQDVEDAIRRQNVEIPTGRLESSSVELDMLAKTGLSTPEEFAAIVVADKDGYLVRLRDIARVELGSAEVRNNTKYNGKPSLALGVRLQSLANPLGVSQKIREELGDIRELLPAGVTVVVASDASESISASINNVYGTLAEAVVLVVLVIFIFLRSLRATLIPTVTIPISLIGVTALMWWWGFSINTLTLLAQVLGIGIVVDDAIVVLENIHRHIENGMEPRKAAIQGSEEIFFAVVAMTITLAAVFAPLAFSEGATGKLFVEFALTLAGAVIISGFIAVTLTPMMCARLLRESSVPADLPAGKQALARLSDSIENSIRALERGYVNVSRRSLRRPWISVLVLLIVTAVALALVWRLPRELAPYEDVGAVRVLAIAPEGTNLAYGEKYMDDLIRKVQKIPEVVDIFANYGNPTVNMHNFGARLVDWDDRERNQFDIMRQVQGIIAEQTGMNFITVNQPPLGQFGGAQPVNLLLQSSLPIEQLARVAGQVTDKLRQNPALQGVNLDLTLNKPQLEISLDREKLADAGIEVDTVSRTLGTLFGGRNVTEFQRGARKYDVVVQLAEGHRREPSDIREIYLRGTGDTLTLLEDVASIGETLVPREVKHFNRLRVANIKASPAHGYALGEALDAAVADIRAMHLEDVTLDYGGQSREYLESGQQIYFTFTLSMIVIYLVLAAQFESFRDPFIILLAVPFAILGASLLLNITGKSFSIFSQIGMITLVGLIAKHGIMLVDTANRQRLEGIAKLDAIIESCAQRFRPIVMTTAAMTLGAVPLALATGAGAESRSQIGWVIVGGLLGGTLLTLLVTPSLYLLISREKLQVSH